MVLPFHFSTDGPSDEKVRKDAEQCFQHPFWTIFTSCFQVFHFSIYFGVAILGFFTHLHSPMLAAEKKHLLWHVSVARGDILTWRMLCFPSDPCFHAMFQEFHLAGDISAFLGPLWEAAASHLPPRVDSPQNRRINRSTSNCLSCFWCSCGFHESETYHT